MSLQTVTSASEDIEVLVARFEERTAHDVSELFLSPHVDEELFLQSTREPGPSLWVVNRSDVYDETLEMLLKHPAHGIPARAQEKLNTRRSILTVLLPPVMEGPLSEVPDYMIEDILGHPLAPIEAILHFIDHPLEDYRGSSALSLTRRVLEHAPNWNQDLGLKRIVQQRFGHMLINDPSPFVRSYCARIPMLEPEAIAEAFAKEQHPRVKAVILQNPAASQDLLNKAVAAKPTDARLCEVALLDRRIDRDLRKSVAEHLRAVGEVAVHINNFFLRKN